MANCSIKDSGLEACKGCEHDKKCWAQKQFLQDARADEALKQSYDKLVKAGLQSDVDKCAELFAQMVDEYNNGECCLTCSGSRRFIDSAGYLCTNKRSSQYGEPKRSSDTCEAWRSKLKKHMRPSKR